MIDPFSKPRTSQEWRERARAIQRQLEGLTIDELMRGAAKHGEPSGRDGREYDPNQPRVPAGHPDGGQWTNQTGGIQGINDPRVLSDATPNNHWIVGADYAAVGHHEHPQALWRNLPLQPKTREVFDKAVSGPLSLTLRNPITGKVSRHRFDKQHREYNQAVGELFQMYLEGLKSRGITPELMTPTHARRFLSIINQSQDPRIADYLTMIKFLRSMRLLRGAE